MAQVTLVPVADHLRYGVKDLTIIATTNPNALFASAIDPRTRYPHHRHAHVCANAEFAQCWETQLQPAIVSTIQGFIPPATGVWTLNVLRLGTKADAQLNPMVVHFTIEADNFSDELAGRLLAPMHALVQDQWNSRSGKETVFIDICKVVKRSIKGAGDGESVRRGAQNQAVAFPSLYEHKLPLPGSSIGIDGTSGTLTGYVKHRLPDNTFEVFVTTCGHVVDPHERINSAGPLAAGDSIGVSSPSAADHAVTKHAIASHVEGTSLWANNPGMSPFYDFWARAKRDSEGYNIELGTVSSISGPEGLDWALIAISPDRITDIDRLNRHFPFSPPALESGFQCVPGTSFSEDDVHTAERYFHPGPTFLPVRQEVLTKGELCLKPPSRTTGRWVAATVNDIEVTVQLHQGAPERKLCLVAAEGHGAVSAAGDSGAIILAQDFRPVAVVWGGVDATNTLPDVTYATSASDLLRNMEEVHSWARGSASFC